MHIINTAIRPHDTRMKHFNPDSDLMSSLLCLFYRLVAAQSESQDWVNDPLNNCLQYDDTKTSCRPASTVRPINQRG